GQRIDAASIVGTLIGDRREVAFAADAIARCTELLGSLPELGLVLDDVHGAYVDHARELARHARALLPKKHGTAPERWLIKEIFADQSNVEDGAECGRPPAARSDRLEVDQGRMVGMTLTHRPAPIAGIAEHSMQLVTAPDRCEPLQQRDRPRRLAR